MLDYYIKRPEKLKHACLAEFAAGYDYSKTKNEKKVENVVEDIGEEQESQTHGENKIILQLKDNLGYIKKRKRDKIIRYVKFKKEDNEIDFYREELMLFLPWNSEADFLSRDMKQLHIENAELIKGNKSRFVYNDGCDVNDLAEEARKDTASDNEGEESNVPNEFQVLDDRTAEGDVFVPDLEPKQVKHITDSFLLPKLIPDNEYISKITNLNEKQKKYHQHITEIVKSGQKGVYECVLGGAGVGKSVLIQCIEQTILRQYYKTPGIEIDRLKVLLCAPTGKAAYNIKGMTLHSAFVLPLNQNSSEIPSISSSTLNSLHSIFKSIDLIIIDEISMVGCRMLSLIDFRLRQIFKRDLPFGNQNIIVFGDFNQLPPVGDKLIFQTNENDPYSVIIGNPLWDLFSGYQLTQIMRQKDDVEFAHALSRLAEGKLTESDIKMFKSRESVPDRHDMYISSEALHLFRTNDEVDAYNHQAIERKNSTSLQVSEAKDNVIGKMSENSKSKILSKMLNSKTHTTYGLPSKLLLSQHIKYMITNNINVSDGLVNGAVGKLMYVETNDDGDIVKLWLKFDDEVVGKLARKELRIPLGVLENWAPIPKLTRNIQIGKTDRVTVCRTQFPLVPAEAITIYKSQGGTYKNIVIHLNKSLKRNELYVACSRATSLRGLSFHGTFVPPTAPSRHDAVLHHTKELLEKRNIFTSISEDLKANKTTVIPNSTDNGCTTTDTILFDRNIKNKTTEITNSIDNACTANNTVLLDRNKKNPEPPSEEMVPPGFINHDNVSCYANSICQALFNDQSLLLAINNDEKDSPIGTLTHSFINHISVLNSKPLRLYIDSKLNQNFFSQNMQQDATEFLIQLMDISSSIKDKVNHSLTTVRRCSLCGYETSQTTPNSVVLLESTDDAAGYTTLKELYDSQYNTWLRRQTTTCPACSEFCDFEENYTITNVQDIVIFNIGLWTEINNEIVKKKVLIKNVPNDKIAINGMEFKVNAAVFHHGQTLEHGHYTTLLRRQNYWLRANDEQVGKYKWPRNAKDMYIIMCNRV